MSDDVFSLRLEGEAARTFTPVLLAAIQGVVTMSETVTQLREAIAANTAATAAQAQAFDAFRQQQQVRLYEALARVETEVAARVQAETDRDAIRAAIEEARTAIEADTAQETELLNAMTAASTPVPTPPTEPTPTEPVVTPPVDTAPVETPTETPTETPAEPVVVVPAEPVVVDETPVAPAEPFAPPA